LTGKKLWHGRGSTELSAIEVADRIADGDVLFEYDVALDTIEFWETIEGLETVE